MRVRIAGACLVLLSVAVTVPLAGQNPWARVPALTTACYTKGDPFGAQVEKAIEDGQAAIAAQEETNAAAKAAMDELDGMTRQSRMTAYLQKNPATASQKMQEMMSAGDKVNAAAQQKEQGDAALKEKWRAVEAQSTKDVAVYGGLFDKARAAFEPGSSIRAQAPSIMAQANEAYRAYCQKWFVAPTSPFLGYLAEYKTYLIEKEVALDEEVFKSQLVLFEMSGVPLNGFKSTANQEAAVKYLKAVDQIFRSRMEEPRMSP